MCTRIMVCHGDKASVLPKAYADPNHQVQINDCKPALYYITSDGKYAIDADHVSAQQLLTGNIDLASVPKVELSST